MVGSDDQAAAIKVSSLYLGVAAPVIVTDPASAETIKYAANAFLATKLSFVNAVAAICEGVGADVNDVVLGLGYDKRIGQDFLRPGPGWGGSCFDGDETLLVRARRSRSRLVRFDELGAERRPSAATDGLEALSWAPERRSSRVPARSRGHARAVRRRDGRPIRTKMGRRLTVTADHPMVARRADGDATGSSLAGELTDRRLAADRARRSRSTMRARRRGLVRARCHRARRPDVGATSSCGSTTEQRRGRARVDHGAPAGRGVRHPPRSGRCGCPRRRCCGFRCADALLGTTTNGTYVPTSIPLDEAMWEIIGLFLAEGHIGADGRRRRVCWSFHPTDETAPRRVRRRLWRAPRCQGRPFAD